MTCPICNQGMKPIFSARVLGKYSAEFEWCMSCGFFRIANPHWLEEAYSSAIAATDTGLVMRISMLPKSWRCFCTLCCLVAGQAATSMRRADMAC